MSREDIVLKKLTSMLDASPVTFKIRMTNVIGMPDVIACIAGRFVGIEVKDDIDGSYTTTKAQLMRMREIVSAGGVACVVDKNNVDSFGQLITMILTGDTEELAYWGFSFTDAWNKVRSK